MAQGVAHAVCVQVEVPQRLVPHDVAHLLQAARQLFGQRPHGHALHLAVHDDGPGSQALGVEWGKDYFSLYRPQAAIQGVNVYITAMQTINAQG